MHIYSHRHMHTHINKLIFNWEDSSMVKSTHCFTEDLGLVPSTNIRTNYRPNSMLSSDLCRLLVHITYVQKTPIHTKQWF